MRSELRSFAQERLKAVCDRGIVHEDHLMTTWKKFVNGDDRVRWAEMWLFIVLEEWLRNNDVKA